MRVSDLVQAMEQIAPTRYAEPWDNVGLLAGDPEQPLRRVLLTIDYTRPVTEEAREAGCDAVVAYHPPIFEAVKRLTAGSLVFDAIRRGVALYSPHTALDVAEGGTNDMLADALGLEERQPLRMTPAKATSCKLVFFAPPDAVEKIAAALFEAGAGRIGNYSCCSFRSPGTGTFFGEASTNPAVGEAGRLERVEELRVETVLPLGRVEEVIRALRAAHPYEEPAFDLVQLAATPEGKGQGRIGRLGRATERRELLERVKAALATSHLLVAGPAEGPATTAAVCAGACGDLLNDALAQQAEFYLTGEMRHHDALRAAQHGMTVVCALHSNSERAVLRRVEKRLREMLSGVEMRISQLDRDPFAVL